MDNSSYKLTDGDIESICQLLSEQEVLKSAWRKVSTPAIAEQFGVSTSAIEYIKRNKLRKYAK